MPVVKNINFEFVGLLILALFPFLPFFFVSVAIVIYLVFSLIESFTTKERCKVPVFNATFFSIQTSFFLFLFLVSALKDGFSPTLKYLEPSISLLLFPIVWFITKTKITSKQKTSILKVFVVSSFLTGLYILSYSVFFSLKNNTSFIVLYEEIPILSIHPHYVGLYFFMSIVILFFESIISNKTVKYILSALFVFLIFSMASRAVLLVLFLFLFIEFFRRNLSFKKKIVALVLIVFSVCSAVYFIKPLHKKVKEVASAKQFELPNKKWPTSAQIRIGLNHCAAPIIKNNWVLGAGIISFEDQLNICYSKFNNEEVIRYNSHNYYSFLVGSAGVFCLFLFLLLLFWHFKISFNQKNWMYFYFLLLMTLSLLTENILSRVYGVVFMLFFMTIFVKTTNTLSIKK